MVFSEWIPLSNARMEERILSSRIRKDSAFTVNRISLRAFQDINERKQAEE
jgi:hypothetical protein